MSVLVSKQNEGQEYRLKCDIISEDKILYRPQYKSKGGEWLSYVKNSIEAQFYDYNEALGFIREQIDKANQSTSTYLYIRKAL